MESFFTLLVFIAIINILVFGKYYSRLPQKILGLPKKYLHYVSLIIVLIVVSIAVLFLGYEVRPIIIPIP